MDYTHKNENLLYVHSSNDVGTWSSVVRNHSQPPGHRHRFKPPRMLQFNMRAGSISGTMISDKATTLTNLGRDPTVLSSSISAILTSDPCRIKRHRMTCSYNKHATKPVHLSRLIRDLSFHFKITSDAWTVCSDQNAQTEHTL